MNHYNSLQTKMTRKLNNLKNLTSYDLYELFHCKSKFLCETMSQINETVWRYVSEQDKIILLIDLVTLEAIDFGKREDTLEMVLQVINCAVLKTNITLYIAIIQIFSLCTI